jgi:hypothetical protein
MAPNVVTSTLDHGAGAWVVPSACRRTVNEGKMPLVHERMRTAIVQTIKKNSMV